MAKPGHFVVIKPSFVFDTLKFQRYVWINEIETKVSAESAQWLKSYAHRRQVLPKQNNNVIQSLSTLTTNPLWLNTFFVNEKMRHCDIFVTIIGAIFFFINKSCYQSSADQWHSAKTS